MPLSWMRYLLLKIIAALLYYSFIRQESRHMSEIQQKPQNFQNQRSGYLEGLEAQFPNISKIPIDLSFVDKTALRKLVNLTKFSIPVHTYQKDLLALYQRISETYYAYIFRNSLEPQPNCHLENDVSKQHIEAQNSNAVNPVQKKPLRIRMNYLDLAKFINNYNPNLEIYVNQDVIRQRQLFAKWQKKEITVKLPTKQTTLKQKKKSQKQEYQELKNTRQKAIKNDQVNITIGKNISRQICQMRSLIKKRAENNRLLEEQLLTQIQQVGVQINFILNRLTQEYFDDFIAQLRPFTVQELHALVLAQKIIEKAQEQHNYIKIYAKLIKQFRKSLVETADKNIKFKFLFVQKLQQSFYQLIRKRQWEGKEQFYKKQLLGLSYFIGQLIHNKILSKFTFSDIFYELIASYIQQYRQHQNNKGFYYHEIYIECIIKVIERMGIKYDQLLANKKYSNTLQICDKLLQVDYSEDIEFYQICDYIEILKEINKKLPSQRFKISFLLEDFRCSKAIKKIQQTDTNNEFEIVKDILAIDHSNLHDLKKIPEMIERCDAQIIMKDFYFQFAEGNIKQVNKNIETFRLFMHLPNVYDAAVIILKQNLQNLSMIDCDFPFLAQGIAKILSEVCNFKLWQWRQLKLQSQDEDINYFIERIQSKFFKLIVQD